MILYFVIKRFNIKCIEKCIKKFQLNIFTLCDKRIYGIKKYKINKIL